jgi:hypothetical protein
VIVVVVLQLLSVKLIEGFEGIWMFFLPQYLTKAILLGAIQLTIALSISSNFFFGINSMPM